MTDLENTFDSEIEAEDATIRFAFDERMSPKRTFYVYASDIANAWEILQRDIDTDAPANGQLPLPTTREDYIARLADERDTAVGFGG
jgi:hypothetical protein